MTSKARNNPEDLTLSPRSRFYAARSWGLCGWSPYPNRGGYSHWYCQRRRWHLGRHRFRNYVAGRIFRPSVRYWPTNAPHPMYVAGRPSATEHADDGDR